MQVQVAGQTFTLVPNGDGYYVSAQGADDQSANYNGSPTVFTFNPPLGPIDKVDAGVIYQQAKAQIEAQAPEAGQFLP